MAFYNSIDNPSNFVASFRDNPRNDFPIFAKGYFQAAFALVEHLLAKQRFSDYEAYPVVFLYRQSLELYLKGIRYKTAVLFAFKDINGIDFCLYNNHRLVSLAQNVDRIFRILFPNDQELSNIVAKINRVSSEFEEIDPDSQSYRYPIDKQGNASTKPHQIVNLMALHETMKELLVEMDMIDFGIDVETTKAQEIYEVFEEVRRIRSQKE